ncbi:MAG: substrate-binding domain-containing protein [Anaerolineales bacterium]|nr:MAG: substrate-binding domain-containing protein [Anaerolineales bacterium]
MKLSKLQTIAFLIAMLAMVLAACGGGASATAAPATSAPSTDGGDEPTGEAGGSEEVFDADPEVLMKTMGVSDASQVNEVVLAAMYRAGLPVSDEMAAKALECWREKVCDTGTGGPITVALADGFGENLWREVTHMEMVLQALTYPEIGRIIYTTAMFDTQQAIADIRGLIAQDVDIIVGFPDAGDALLPVVQEATDAGVIYVTHSYGVLGDGSAYFSSISEDVCLLGQEFARILNEEVGTGKVAFLGGTPGNPLSAYWQSCEQPELGSGLELVGVADTFWTREGTFEAMSGFLSAHPDLAGVSYEAAGSFMGGLSAYEAAGLPVNLVLTLRTDETVLFCEWVDMGQPDEFKIFFGSGGNYQSRIALTAAMMHLNGYDVPNSIVIPPYIQPVNESHCYPDLPDDASISSMVPHDIVRAMYP